MTLTERTLIEKFLAFGFSFDHFTGSEIISFVYYKD